MTDPLTESKVAKAANAAAIAEEAKHNALVEALSKALIPILNKALTYDNGDRPALVARIPAICTDIRNIMDDIKNIQDNITWGVRIIIGAIILALVAMVIKTNLWNLLSGSS